MNESMDRVLADWLDEGPEGGPRDGLERALAATRRVGQRPGWTLPERWIPMQLTMAQTRSQRQILTIAALALLLVALFATALFIGSQRHQPSPPFRNGAIVFEQEGDLFIADQLGGTPRTLVGGPEVDSRPVFSPQGDRIAFVRGITDAFACCMRMPGMGVTRQIMMVHPDGSGVVELAEVDSLSLRLAWAPDRSALLASGDGRYFLSPDGQTVWDVNPTSRRLYVIESDGSGSRMLDVDPGVIPGTGAWRPDGRRIAFIGWQEDGHVADVLYVADADGSNVRRLPIDLLDMTDGLEWSPDGTRLALGAPGGTAVTIVDIDPDGDFVTSHQIPLDPESILEPPPPDPSRRRGFGSSRTGPSWSPDGMHLAVVLASGRVGIVAADASGVRTVGPNVNASVGSVGFVWSPDGRSIVITGPALAEEPDTRITRWTDRAWSVDIATGEQTELETSVASWQRLTP